MLYVHNLAPPLCYSLERELLRDGTCLDESLTAHGGWGFWIQLSRKSSFFHFAAVTSEYRNRIDRTNLSKNTQGRLDTLIEVCTKTEHEIVNYSAIIQMRPHTAEYLREQLTNFGHSPAYNYKEV